MAGYDLHGLNLPSKQVGGDYFDILRPADEVLLLTIADVSGKGMPAALLMANLQAGLHILHGEDYPLDRLTQKLNELIFNNTSIEHFVTFFVLKLWPAQGRFEYVNAGHNPPYLLRSDGRLEELNEGGLILGVVPQADYTIGQGRMEVGDVLTMYTDGVTECLNVAEQEFSEQRLQEILLANARRKSCRQLNELIVDRLRRFARNMPQTDDITLLTIKRLS
ncbi:MAG: hypothetical protein D6743_05100 [Calditrichaeota bacterium]|nr:MAG: hypothetical protein D6743_05100 [Calditrichota bacterium]